MRDKKKKLDYAVGYRKPPECTQFKPGRSGNPNGRPRKKTTFADDLEAEMKSKVTITQNGKVRKITKSRIIATQQVHKAMKGSVRATKLVVQCLPDVQSDSNDNLSELVEEFRNRDHCLRDDRAKEDDDTAGSTESQPDPEGDKS